MKKETKTIVYDNELQIEAYHFKSTQHSFPNHFHDHYVIGFVENGERCLSCKNQEFTIEKGNILLFNPNDNHACIQSGDKVFDYCGFNISQEVMLNLAKEVTGKEQLPGFSKNVIFNEEIACYLHPLHKMVMNRSIEFGKEENLLLLISMLIQTYGQPFTTCIPECREEIEKACFFIEEHFSEHIYLEQICCYAGLSKSTLLRAFTKSKGVTPYRYLETVRINKAKRLLEKGVTLIEAAMQTGFSDQSHFTNYFKSFIGLSPGVYRQIFLEKNETRGKQGEE